MRASWEVPPESNIGKTFWKKCPLEVLKDVYGFIWKGGNWKRKRYKGYIGESIQAKEETTRI